MNEISQPDAAGLLARVRAGDADAGKRLFGLLYDDLRGRAGRLMRGQPSDHTLQATALLGEAWIRLAADDAPDWRNSTHFLAVATSAMKCVLVDHARQKSAQKRGGDRVRVPLAGLLPEPSRPEVDLLDLTDALERLARVDPRAARIVELRYFGGLTTAEAAQVESVSSRAAERDWAAARAWLRRALK